MDAFEPEMFPDLVQVLPVTWNTDADAGVTEADGTAASVPASVQRVTFTSVGTRREEDLMKIPMGTIFYNVLFPSAPAITAPDQNIAWVSNNQGAISPPVILQCQGAMEPPDGLTPLWRVTVLRRR